MEKMEGMDDMSAQSVPDLVKNLILKSDSGIRFKKNVYFEKRMEKFQRLSLK